MSREPAHQTTTEDKTGEVLVGVLNDLRDLAIAKEERWYRIPVDQARKWINDRWPPDWLAFYHTKSIESEPYGVYYYARVQDIHTVPRHALFPQESHGIKAGRLYHQLLLGDVQRLERPILSAAGAESFSSGPIGRSSCQHLKLTTFTMRALSKIACGRNLSAGRLKLNVNTSSP